MSGPSSTKISVISPSYNQGAFIEDAIKSVLSQGYDNFEHIIVDACSTDETIEILKKYKHLIWISEKDDGQSDAINKGVKMATGEWILWLNVDDYIQPDTFKHFLNAIKTNRRIDYVYGHTIFVNENRESIKKVIQIPYFYFYTLWQIYIPPSTGSFIRTRFFKDNPLDKEYHMVMDVEWFLRCGSNIKTLLVNKTFSAFRISENNKTAEHIKNNVINHRHLKERQMNYQKYISTAYLFSEKNLPRYVLRMALKVLIFALYYSNKVLYSITNRDDKHLSNL